MYQNGKNTVKKTLNMPRGLVERIEEYSNEINVNWTAALCVLASEALKAHDSMETMAEMIDMFRDMNEKLEKMEALEKMEEFGKE